MRNNNNNYRAAGEEGGAIQIPTASDFGTLAFQSATYFARRHKVITSSYLFGLLILIISGTGTKLTWDQRREYNRIMTSIDLEAEMNASNQYYSVKYDYDRTKGWFTCDATCTRYKQRTQQQKSILDNIRKEGENRMSDAKATAGIFSEIGVGEVKDSFWGYFQSGKRYAKRQSMFDAMFIGMRSIGRDESMIDYVFKVLLQALLNFSMGLVMALVFFIFGLWSIVKTYQPNPLTALTFFLFAVCASFAFVATYILAMYGLAAGGVYGVAKIAENQARIQGGANAGRNGRYPHMHNRPHHD